MKFWQQGDVIARAVKSIPAGAKLKPHRRGWVLAEGEVTNHAHEVIGEGVEVFEKDGLIYLSAPNGGTVKHEEHLPIALAPGNYQIGIVREFDHYAEEARRVQD